MLGTTPRSGTTPPPTRRLTAILAAVATAVTGTLVALPIATAEADVATDLTALVNPFVGTAGDNGNDLPGAQVPNGLVKVNPMTTPGRNHSGYDWNQSKISGFTQTNMDGVGGSGAGGDFLVVPTSVNYTARPSTASYAHTFSHADEEATPGYYRVGLSAISGNDGAVTAPGGTINSEMTVDTRSSVQRYSFPTGQAAKLVVDLSNNFTSRRASDITVSKLADGRAELTGSFTGFFNGATYKLYYAAVTEQAIASFATWGNGTTLDATATRTGTDTGAVITFPAGTSTVGMRLTLSPISVTQARTDMAAEIGGKSFDDVRAAAKAEWQERLASVELTTSATSDPDGELAKLFYTHLYRMSALPMNATSTSGTYKGIDGAVHKVDGYTYYDGWASWDDFRKYSVFAYVQPELYRDIVQSLVSRMADQTATGSTNVFDGVNGVPNVRYERSAVIVADGVSKGYDFTRLDEAFPSLKALTGYYTGQQLRQGWVDGQPGVGAQRGYDQWALSVIADELGKTDEAAELRRQAALPLATHYKPGAWTAADGTQVGLLTPRNSAGDWTAVDYEKFEQAGLYQGTLWQYNWYPAYDMAGLIDAMGGTEATRLALRHMFGEDDPTNGKAMLHSNANEIDLQAPYLFNYVGEPALTQKWARAIYTKSTWNRYIATGQTDGNNPPSGGGEFTPPINTKVYKLAPDGLLPTMDNDAATMSTMFVAAALGVFPVTAGSGQYQLGSPFFEAATLHQAGGKTFTIRANNVSADNFYVQSATLNGSDWNNTWLNYDQIVRGGSLDLTMGASASDWGKDSAPSFSMSLTDQPSTAATYGVEASSTTVAASETGTLDSTVALKLTGGVALADAVGTSLLTAGHATLSGLPTGVSADVTVTDATTATLTLTGTLATNARVWVNFLDGAFADGVPANAVAGQGTSATSPIQLSVATADRAALQSLVDDAVLVRQASSTTKSFRSFSTALAAAQTVLANADATAAQLRAAAETLQSAANALAIDKGGYRVLQAEESDDWSGGSLTREAYQSTGNLGGVKTGSWVSYSNLDFAGTAPKYLQVNYANTQATTAAPSAITLHAGDINGPVIGRADLPGTGSWGAYRNVFVTIDDPQALVDAKQVTMEFAAAAGQDWVANFEWFQFLTELPKAPVVDAAAPYVLQAESYTSSSGGALKSESSTWKTAGAVVNVGATYDGMWMDFATVDFGDVPVTGMSVSYVNNSNRVGANSRLEVYIDAADPANPGTPFTTISLPVTGADWSTDGVASVDFPSALSGKHRITIVGHADVDGAHPYVANLDKYSFKRAEQTTALIQAEGWTTNSGNGLKSENSTWSDGAVTNVGGTYTGAWLSYEKVDFGLRTQDQVSVHYVHNSGRCGTNARLEFYLDATDPANPGTPVATVTLPTTGANWTTAGNAVAKLAAPVSGVHTVLVKMFATVDSGHPYVANIDSYTFSKAAPVVVTPTDFTALKAAITSAEAVTDLNRYVSIDVAAFQRELAAAKALVADAKATQEPVDAQTRTLLLAKGQLVPAVRRQLENLTADAGSRINEHYTDASWDAMQSSLTAARATLANASATDEALAASLASLQKSIDALAMKDLTVPSVPLAVAAAVEGTSITVTWSDPADNGGTPVTGWTVRLDDGHELRIGDATQHSATFTWLDPAKAYAATVVATNKVGDSEASAPTAPLMVSATAATETAPATGTTATTTTEAPAAHADETGTPFPAGTVDATYASDAWPATTGTRGYEVELLRGMDELPTSVLAPNTKITDASQVTAVNDKVALSINHSATTAQVDRAQRDADNSALATGTDALGSTLGPIFSTALNAGELPKTKAMLDRMAQRIPGADAVKPVWLYQRPYVRMGLASRGGLVWDSKAGGYDGLAGSGSFPSGHTYGGYVTGTTLATLLPDLAPSILARASEYGDNRIVIGFHYPLDVMGGRILGQAVVAHRWADPEFQALLQQAHLEAESVLGAKCATAGFATLETCSGTPYAGLSDQQAVDVYTSRLTYSFPQTGRAGAAIDVPDDAVALLTTAFPELTDAQRRQILEQTALDSGYALDLTADGDESWQRINLAKAMTADYVVAADGTVTVNNYANETAVSVATLTDIKVAGISIDGFDPATRTYSVDWPEGRPLPQVQGVASEADATVKVSGTDADERLTITVTSANGGASEVWTVDFYRTADDHLPDAVADEPTPTVTVTAPEATEDVPGPEVSVTATTTAVVTPTVSATVTSTATATMETTVTATSTVTTTATGPAATVEATTTATSTVETTVHETATTTETATAAPETTTVEEGATVTQTPPAATATVPGPVTTATSTTKAPVVMPVPKAPYEVPGFHFINGRQWFTACEPYGQTIRCRTDIWATQVVRVGGSYVTKSGWVFNNWTYLPLMTRKQWGSNPLANAGTWTSSGHQWLTECDTPATGKNACRTYVRTTVIKATTTSTGYSYGLVNDWVVNNIVKFRIG